MVSWFSPAISSLGTGASEGAKYEPFLDGADRKDRRKLDFLLPAQPPVFPSPGIPSSILLSLPATSSKEAAILTSWVFW